MGNDLPNHKEAQRRWYDSKGRDRYRVKSLGGKYLPPGEEKRPYTGKCELCGATYEDDKSKFHYHHWIDEEPTIGIWVCVKCHWMIEAVDTGLLQKYEELKPLIEKECAMKMLGRFGLLEVVNG
ncbi:hypothetical protein LCGC14_0591420 [marine sediment metagenome]|uniref:Uncharacterized protein n=1 Tax=marine sediment metagenome TaxID=412755 RepID=A0A0F9RDE4_9ZZZZ